MIFELLKARSGGIWSKLLGNEFKTVHRKEPPQDIVSLTLSLPFATRDE